MELPLRATKDKTRSIETEDRAEALRKKRRSAP